MQYLIILIPSCSLCCEFQQENTVDMKDLLRTYGAFSIETLINTNVI